MKKLPYGIIAGLSGIFAFYDTLAIIVLYIVFNQIESQTTHTATIFDSWYQTLMFILDIVFVLLFIASLIFYIKKKVTRKKGEINEA